jgi:HAD superfamily hydrolase (TIGR01490 family)
VNPSYRGAAFFDVDKTILPGVSAEMLFAKGLLNGALPGRFAWFSFLIEAIRLLPRGLTIARKANKAYLAGADPEDVRVWGRKLFDQQVEPRLGGSGEEWIARERRRGRAIVLLSGMPDLLLEPFAARFRPDLAIGTPLEVGANGRLTGRHAGPHPYGVAKLVIAKGLAEENGWDPKDCSAYGDHASDAYVLGWAGEAFAVDPDDGLRREAERHGWTILATSNDPAIS